jgi:hypothetical protein
MSAVHRTRIADLLADLRYSLRMLLPVVVLGASPVAVWLPARTIAKVDTMRALQSE